MRTYTALHLEIRTSEGGGTELGGGGGELA